MKIVKIKEPKKFFQKLEQCKGNIELITSEGDRLNLKSRLCQYVALSEIFNDAVIGDIELQFSEPEDVQLILDYLVRG